MLRYNQKHNKGEWFLAKEKWRTEGRFRGRESDLLRVSLTKPTNGPKLLNTQQNALFMEPTASRQISAVRSGPCLEESIWFHPISRNSEERIVEQP